MTNARTLWLVRHGDRQDSADPDWERSAERPLDPPLSPAGGRQAEDVARRLADEEVSAVISSPFLRAVQTAAPIAAALDLPVWIEPGLCECLFEKWYPHDPELRLPGELRGEWPVIDATASGAVTVVWPEDEEGARLRCAAMAAALHETYEGDLVLVGHGGSFQWLCNTLLGHRADILPALCCLIQLRQEDGHWMLRRDGRDLSHLSEPMTEVRIR